MSHVSRLCSRCKSNISLPYHNYCHECRAQYREQHPEKRPPYIPHPRPEFTWEELYWPKVNKTDGCWFWTGCINRRGYPAFRGTSDRVQDAGRFLYEQLFGSIPEGYILYRTCRVRHCVKPEHLKIGTRKELPKEDAEIRFWQRVNKNGPVPAHQPHLGNCWLWTERINPLGYGQFFFNGRDEGAHRVSWQFAHGIGSIPKNKWVCHHCDVRACVRPEHLFLETPEGDVLDMVRKGRGRHLRGEQSGRAKLTEAQAMWVLENYVRGTTPLTYFAKALNVTTQCIFAIITGRAWSHLKRI